VLKGYRRRFVVYNMLLVGVVLLIALIYQGVYLYRASYQELQNTMRLIVEPLGGAPWGAGRFEAPGSAPAGMPNMSEPPSGGGFAPEDELRRSSEEGILAVIYDSAGDSYVLLSPESFLDEETLDAAVRAAAAETGRFGRLPELGVYFYKEGGGEISRIALADTAYLGSRTVKNFLTLAAVFVVSMALVFVISVFLSKLAAKPMEEAVELERQFVADISHDLKTPITVILANNSILRSNPDSGPREREQWLSSTDEAAKNMMNLVGEMLTLSNLDAVGRSVVRVPVDLSSAAEKAALQLESLAYERGVEIETELAEGVTVLGDAEYCARICGGLLENALKYEPEGGCVRVGLTAARKKAVLTVRNRGSYIPPEDLPHIFERFYRGDKSRSSRGGHGLGLPIIRQMTELLGGEISAESSEEAGTVFTVTLPLAE
jgi:signal transduction histidine kinase